MPTTETNFTAPPQRETNLAPGILKWLLSVQMRLPLRTVDTSSGPYAEDAPAAGGEAAGPSNLNHEIIYVKTSADGNVFTLNGVQGGPYTLVAQYQRIRIKSDGTNWWRVD